MAVFGNACKDEGKSSKIKNPYIRRTLSEWFNMLIDTGFVIEKIDEPFANTEQALKCPAIADKRIVPHFLIIRARKPE